MGVNLETVVFDAAKFEKELEALGKLLKKPELSEADDVQPFSRKANTWPRTWGSCSPRLGPRRS